MTDLFKIYKFNPSEISHIEASRNEPHGHDYEELLVGAEGTLKHFIDFHEKIMEAPFLSFVTKGKIHRVVPGLQNGACTMWVMRFRSEFIPETIFQLYSFYHDNANLCFTRDHCFARLVTLCEMMVGEMTQPSPDLAVVRQLLSTLFTMIESERRKQLPEEVQWQTSHSQTFRNFLAILEENFRRPEGVNFYAEKLFMSARNLNLICQQILQQSISEIIETRKLIEAKNLLVTTDKTVAEIGFELGYNDKTYFTRAFKKKAGQTPTDFREDMRRLMA